MKVNKENKINTLEALMHLKNICNKEEDCKECEIKKILGAGVYQTIPEEWKLLNKEGETMIKIILILIGISVVFSTGFTAGATWNYIHTTISK